VQLFEKGLIAGSLGLVGFLAVGMHYSGGVDVKAVRDASSSQEVPRNSATQSSEESVAAGSVDTEMAVVATDGVSNAEICTTSIDCLSKCIDRAAIKLGIRLGASEEEARIRILGDPSWFENKIKLMESLAVAQIFGKAIVGQDYSVAETDGVKLFLLDITKLDETMGTDVKACIVSYEELESRG
jgi:hypothetical protein